MDNVHRRSFLKNMAAISAFTIVKPAAIFGSPVNSAIRVGIIGCGGRGTAVISGMSANTNIQIIAMADIFESQVQKAKPVLNKLNTDKGLPVIPPANMYWGSKAYLKLLNNQDVDVVLISSPSYTHPDFVEAAVAAGKHIYCEKPAAIDVEGCKKVERISKRIGDKQSVVFGFIIPYATPYKEMMTRVQRGDIGEVVSAELCYLAGRIELKPYKGLSYDEARIRNHYHFNDLCGGILTEQSIHLLDVCNKTLNALPIEAKATGSINGGPDFGDTWTNYQVVYKYPKGVNVSLHATQLGSKWGDVCTRFIGTKGIAEGHYAGGVYIVGDNEWDSGVPRTGTKQTKEEMQAGRFQSSLQDADSNKVKAFIGGIENGQYRNEASDCVNSTLTAILGRRAAVTGDAVTWEQMLFSNERLDPQLNLAQFDNLQSKIL